MVHNVMAIRGFLNPGSCLILLPTSLHRVVVVGNIELNSLAFEGALADLGHICRLAQQFLECGWQVGMEEGKELLDGVSFSTATLSVPMQWQELRVQHPIPPRSQLCRFLNQTTGLQRQ